MNQSKHIMIGALTGLGLVVSAFVAIPSTSSAGVTAMDPAERVSGAFEVVAEMDVAKPQDVRTVTIGYQIDTTAAVLIRKPGQQVATR